MEQTSFKVIRTVQEGGGVFAVVRLVEYAGGEAILKDFSRSPRLFRSSFGALLTAHETRAYRRLDGAPGVPRLIRRIGRDGLLVQCVAGVNCRDAAPNDLTQGFFDAALELFSRVRARGVLHMDIGRNLILGVDGRPWLVDFGSSLVLSRALGPLRSRMTNLRKKYDERALFKIKRRKAPHLLRESELERSAATLPLERWVTVAEKMSKVTVGLIAGAFDARARRRDRQG